MGTEGRTWQMPLVTTNSLDCWQSRVLALSGLPPPCLRTSSSLPSPFLPCLFDLLGLDRVPAAPRYSNLGVVLIFSSDPRLCFAWFSHASVGMPLLSPFSLPLAPPPPPTAAFGFLSYDLFVAKMMIIVCLRTYLSLFIS